MTPGGQEESTASQIRLGRTLESYGGVATGYVGTDCKAAASKKKLSTKCPVHRKGRPSREEWRAVPPIPPLKGRVRGEALTLFSASMCRNGTFSQVRSFYELPTRMCLV